MGKRYVDAAWKWEFLDDDFEPGRRGGAMVVGLLSEDSSGCYWLNMAYKTFWQQQQQNERLAVLQVQAQQASTKSQRDVAEAQIASGLIPLLRCDSNSQQKQFALEVLQQMESRYATSVLALSFGSTCKTPLPSIDSVRRQVGRAETAASLRDNLRLAGQLYAVDLFRDAADAYRRALTLARTISHRIDEDAAKRGLIAFEGRQYKEAADRFQAALQFVLVP